MKISLKLAPLFLFLFSAELFAIETAIDFKMVNTEAEWNRILTDNKTTLKPIFVDVYTDWCGYCKMMDRDVFSDDEVGDYFNSQFVNVKLDAETEFGALFAANFDVTGYPTYLILDDRGNFIGDIVGYTEKQSLLESAEAYIEGWKMLPGLSKKFANGTISDKELMDYAVLLDNQGDAKAQGIIDQLLNNIALEDIMDPDNAEFLASFIEDADLQAYLMITQHKDRFIDIHGPEVFFEIIGNVYNNLLSKAIDTEDESYLVQLTQKVIPYYTEGQQELERGIFVTRKMFWAYIGDVDSYKKEVESFRSQQGSGIEDFWYGEAYEIIEDYYDSDEMMALAEQWLDKSLEDLEDFATYYLYAYAKGIRGDYPGARLKAEKALDLATDEDEKEAIQEIIAMIDDAEEDN